MTTTPTRPVVPLAVWPITPTAAPQHHPADHGADHLGGIGSGLAWRIVAEYSAPGQIVLDPFTRTTAVVVEAALAGRSAIGVVPEPGQAARADAELHRTLPAGSRRLAEIAVGDAACLPGLLGSLAGRVDLIVTSPPARAGRDQAGYEAALTAIYAAWQAVLRPGGRLVVVTGKGRSPGRTRDLAGLTVSLAQAAGFTYLQHVIALRSAIRDGALAARPSRWEEITTRRALLLGEPVHLRVHDDVIVLVRPASPDMEATGGH